MEYTYEEITTEVGTKVIKRIDQNGQETWIPVDLANSDYEEYLNPSEAETI
jgi:hypothetical protein